VNDAIRAGIVRRQPFTPLEEQAGERGRSRIASS
jgi:hypothetical protein